MLQKLTPHQDLLCYFFRPTAIAALSGASDSGFTVSGSWRQQFDWCVIDWVRDNTFEHPSFRNLPDGDLSGLTLTYDETRDNCILVDSDLFPTVDWPSLRVFDDNSNGLPMAYVPLKNYATAIAGSYTCASATVTLGGTITAGDYIGISFLGEAYTYQVTSSDTITTAAAAIAADITTNSPGMIASSTAGAITVTYVGQDSGGTKLTTSTSTTGANGNRLALYTYTTGSTETWDVVSKPFSGGTSPTQWRYTIPFGSLVDVDGNPVTTTNVRKLRWTYAADLQAATYSRSEFSVSVTNWTVTGTNRAYSVAGGGSKRIEDFDLTPVGTWTPSKGNYSNGTITCTSTTGDSITCPYNATVTHSLYLGTRVIAAGATVQVTVDGTLAATESLTIAGEDVLVRRLIGQYSAGSHTVVVTNTGSSGTFYFDFLELALPTTDLPTYTTESNITLATDWDTDHSLALAAERTAGMLPALGFLGRHNCYVGALEFYELAPLYYGYASQILTFTGTPNPGDTISIAITQGTTTTTIAHVIQQGDTPTTIALAFALILNKGYTAIWAQSTGAQLTVTSRAIGLVGNTLSVTATPSSGAFYGSSTTTSFTSGADPAWYVDLTATPRINRAARDWLTAFFTALKSYGIDGTAAFSTELGNGDPGSTLAQRYSDGNPVIVSTPALQTNFSPDSIAYWKQVYLDAATIQSNAGLQPYLQFGEVQWWYFPEKDMSGADISLPFYDSYTTSTFASTYGHAMSVITADTVSPASFPDEAAFLPTLIGAYTDAIMTFVRATYSNCRFEVLYPTDTNSGSFDAAVNYPTATWTPAVLTNLKTESFTYTLDRNMQLAEQDTLDFGQSLGFTALERSHLIGVSDPTTPWLREARLAQILCADSVVLFALDQFCLIGYPLPLGNLQRRASFNR
ncbi:MAG TPA: hypothetical protein VGL53_20055 [Bryobacteraceae bacterium]|jgi:hypothetical protein